MSERQVSEAMASLVEALSNSAFDCGAGGRSASYAPRRTALLSAIAAIEQERDDALREAATHREHVAVLTRKP